MFSAVLTHSNILFSPSNACFHKRLAIAHRSKTATDKRVLSAANEPDTPMAEAEQMIGAEAATVDVVELDGGELLAGRVKHDERYVSTTRSGEALRRREADADN